MTIDQKLTRLETLLFAKAPLAVAFSGGIDSTFLLAKAVKVLGPKRVLALTVESPLHADWELAESQALAKELGVRQIIVTATDILDVPEVRENSSRRCYFCKKLLFSRALDTAKQYGFENLADGSNFDDLSDYRPGRQAVEELHILSPLIEAGLGKQDIRQLSQGMGLPNWAKPANACLATRIKSGTQLTLEMLERVNCCEKLLREKGFAGCRARIHGKLLRIELPPQDIARFATTDDRQQIVQQCQDLGFEYVTLDLAGYRTGSMNHQD